MHLTHLSLFSGIGGFDLAAEWAGFETICFVEINKFRQQVLRKHWSDVPIIEDVRDVKGEQFGAVTLITGGFPCQPVSVTGKQRGKADDRWLWPEMFRVVQKIRPTWVVGENVAGIIRMELDNCISDLEGISYSCQTFVIPACAVNAPHRRDRVFIVAYATSSRCESYNNHGNTEPANVKSSSQDVADTKEPKGRRLQASWWAAEPDVGRVAHGVPSRVDRLAALGDAVVPQQVYPILRVIADIERESR